MTKQSTTHDPETITMTTRMYRYYEKRAAKAGTTVLVYLRREFHVSSRRSLQIVAFDSVRDFPMTRRTEANGL
jgi:hypothetical protein